MAVLVAVYGLSRLVAVGLVLLHRTARTRRNEAPQLPRSKNVRAGDYFCSVD